MGLFSSSKPKRKKTLSYYKSQAKKLQAKLDIKEAKKKIEQMKSKL